MTHQDALVKMINYLEIAQSRGVYSLREAREIADAIDFIVAPAAPAPQQKDHTEKPGPEEVDDVTDA